ncbi:MAG: transglutaminase domain-containing protein [Alistipes sp.]|nr:transglutaminase domain-containing protein [Alistipes sp.]
MLKRKIKTALSLATLAAFLSAQIGCAAGGKVQNNIGGGQEEIVVENDTLQLEYSAAYDNFCRLSEADEASEVQRYAAELSSDLKELRSQLEAEIADTHNVIDKLGSSVINDRQSSYEKEIDERLTAAENAAEQLSGGSISLEENIEALSELFAVEETEFIPTAVPSLNTETEAGLEELKGELPEAVPLAYAAVSETDLNNSAETEISDEIKELADSLGSAKNVYEYVKNNIRFEPYYGSRKGAVGTFEQNGGNDTDTASLLIGMLRYLGYPARYHVGTAFITPEQAVELTGAADAENAGRLLASQYKPVASVMKNGEICGFKMTQTWVDAYVPYTDYRGAGNEQGENVWVSLDASFKAVEIKEAEADCQYPEGVDEFNQKIADLDDTYAAADKITLRSREIIVKNEKYLPVSLPYQVFSSEKTFSAVPSDMSDKISVDVGWDQLFSMTTAELYGKNIIICYEGENSCDDELIQSYGGVENVPAHLVNVVPTAIVGDEVFRGEFGVTLGTAQQMNTYISNRGGSSALSDKVNAGSVYAITLDLQRISPQDIERSQLRMEQASDYAEKYGPYSGKSVGAILDYAGKAYFTACDTASFSGEFASDVNSNRMLGLAFTGYTLKNETFFGMVRKLHYGNFYIDVAYNNVTTISYSGNTSDEIKYMMSQGAAESAYEGKVWEAILGEGSFGISTMSMFALSDAMNIDRVLITSADLEEMLARCDISDNTKRDVRNFVNQGCIVEIIPKDIKVNKWEGTAYIAYDLTGKTTSYMLSGGTAGGSASNNVKLEKPSATYMNVDDAMDFCYRVNNFIYLINVSSALSDLSEAASMMSSAMSPLGQALAGIPAMNAAKSLGDAWAMYYENLELYLEYAITGKAEDAVAMLNFTIENVLGVLGDSLEELLPTFDVTFFVGGIEINLSDFEDFADNFFPKLSI